MIPRSRADVNRSATNLAASLAGAVHPACHLCYLASVPDPIPIPFHKPSITRAEVDAVSAVLRSGWLTTGPKARELEEAVAKYVGSSSPPHAVALSSCTAALHLALIAAGVGPNDEVVTSPYTFVSTGETILYLNAKPVFVDVEPSTKNLDPAKLEPALTPRTKAIVSISIAGHPCRSKEIGAIASRRGIPVIEDAAHSPTARTGDAPVGTQADITCFSFYATKGVTAGEGGMAATARQDWADRIRRLCLHGLSDAAWSRLSSVREMRSASPLSVRKRCG